MNNPIHVPVKMLGQSGCSLFFPEVTIYFDPYLSNSVQEIESPDMERQVPIPIGPECVKDADWVILSHAHIDHCDPNTIPVLAHASPQSRFVGPAPVIEWLTKWGINPERIVLATQDWISLASGLRLCAIPAAHPEIVRDEKGRLSCVGYLLDYSDQRIYYAGDTSARKEIINALNNSGPVHTAFLPVNEHNYFKEIRGIIGNMSVRESFQFAVEIGARQVVPIHWDMFAANNVEPDEIRLLHKKMEPGFDLLIEPSVINLSNVCVSIIIRTFNEAAHFDTLLNAIEMQQTEGLSYEVLIVDSGSTDETLEIAQNHGCHICHITREAFSFGRSLNIGCEAAQGNILVIISGHCVPVGAHWLQKICKPLIDGQADYVYGRQIGSITSYFSECCLFGRHYPEQSSIPQDGYFVNNANSALKRDVYEAYHFSEELPGLEDMEFARHLVKDGGTVGYIADASVIHHHNESWQQVRCRFEREAIALRDIMPQVHVDLYDTLRFFISSLWQDWGRAWSAGIWQTKAREIVQYRWNQYLGAYLGNHDHRKLSQEEKERYFFPK